MGMFVVCALAYRPRAAFARHSHIHGDVVLEVAQDAGDVEGIRPHLHKLLVGHEPDLAVERLEAVLEKHGQERPRKLQPLWGVRVRARERGLKIRV